MSVTLRKRKNADGTTSLRLDIYHNGKRFIETLKHLQLLKPSNLADQEHNKKKLKQAKEISVARAAELEAQNYNIADYMNTPEKIKKGRQWMCNAKSEKILGDRKSYWHRIRNKRCLIPVTGTFEHREVKTIKNKIPYLVRLKDRSMFCIPGLYHYSPIPDVKTGEVRGTFTLLTRGANSEMKQIHNGGTNA